MRRSRSSKSFTIFAIAMVVFLVLGTIVVFGGAIFDSTAGDESLPVNEAERQQADLETQVAEDPSDPDAAAILASIYANQGNITDAIPLYERATAGRPDDGSLRLAFGITLFRGGSFLDARVQLERALELLPNSPSPSYYLGQIAQQQDEPDLEAARDWYERAIEIDPESTIAAEAEQRLAELDAAHSTPTP